MLQIVRKYIVMLPTDKRKNMGEMTIKSSNIQVSRALYLFKYKNNILSVPSTHHVTIALF